MVTKERKFLINFKSWKGKEIVNNFLIEKILIEQVGEDAIFLCKKDFDPMGGKDMIYRLEVLEELAKEKENDFYISLLENSSPSIREKAMILLGYSSQNIDLLIHLAETEKGKYKIITHKEVRRMVDAMRNSINRFRIER